MLKQLTLPDSLENIDDYSFSFCSELTHLVIPDSVKSIGKWAFSWCLH